MGISIDRLYDTPFASNICDFILFLKPNICYLECKSCYGNTLNFQKITQWERLLPKASIDGAISGVIVWFIDKDDTLFVPIEILENLRLNGAKSLNYEKHRELCYKVPGKKRRVLFDYDFSQFFAWCDEYMEGKI